MSYYGDLRKLIQEGLEDKNKGISLGLPRLDRYVTLRRKMFYMVIGSSGSGKSALLHSHFILTPLEQEGKNCKLKYILFSMERSKAYIHAKWLIRRIFLDTGTMIPLHTLLNWYGDKMTSEAISLVETYEDYFTFLEEHIEMYEGGRSPNDIFRIVNNYAIEHGHEEKIDEHKKIYISNNPEEMVVVAADHSGLVKTTANHPTKKQAIDKLVEDFQKFRDYYGYSDILVNQMNRDLSSPLYMKLDSFEPNLDSAKETGTTVEAADVVMSVFEPSRYGTNDKFYGDVNKFRDPETGRKYFRSIKVLKNSYGIDDSSIGTVFQGEIGQYAELPKSSVIRESWKDYDYQEIFNNNYFLQK